MGNKEKKICIVIPYFGKWPNYFPFFLKSCELNPSIDWFFYTNCDIPQFYSKNVKFISKSLEDFNTLASEKLEYKIDIKYPYKLCDFKPAYGHIFEDYLEGYDFWGFGDIDVIYGNIRNFFTDEILSKFDIITTYSHSLSGPFTILKNDKIKYLYRDNNDYKKAFLSQDYVGFDETNLVFDKDIFHSDSSFGKTGIKSMSHFLREISQNKFGIKIYANSLCININPNERGEIIFDNGILKDCNNREIFLVHFLMIRINNKILLPQEEVIRTKFFIGSYGISYNNVSNLTRKIILIKVKFVSFLKVRVGTFLKKFFPKFYYFYKRHGH